jgi:hypothetical protein
MTVWLVRLGALCALLGAMVVSPLADLLPADWNVDGRGVHRTHAVFFRSVPAPAFGTRVGFDEAGAALIVAGLAIVCAGVVVRHTRCRSRTDRGDTR